MQVETIEGPSPTPSPPDPIETPTGVVKLPRPSIKPALVTQYELDTMWDADLNTMRLGVLLPLDGPLGSNRLSIIARKALSVIRLAVNEINENQIVPGVAFSIMIRNSEDPGLTAVNTGSGPVSAAGKLINSKVSGIIGDIRSDFTRFEAMITSSVGIPQCSFASASTELSNADTYAHLYRTIPTLIPMLQSILQFIKDSGWRRVILIYDSDTLGWLGKDYFFSTCSKLDIHVLDTLPILTPGVPFDPNYTHIKDRIRSSNSRVQIVLAAGKVQENFLRSMMLSGFMNQYFAWVVQNEISESLRNRTGVNGYNGMIMVDHGWNLTGSKPFPGAADPVLSNNEAMAYSCVMMLAYTYANLIRENVPNPEDRNKDNIYIKSLLAGGLTYTADVRGTYNETAYDGPSGPFHLDINGDRDGGYFMFYSMKHGIADNFASSLDGVMEFIKPPFFKDGINKLPNDAPPDAIENPRWRAVPGLIMGIFSIIGIVLVVISAVIVIYFRDHPIIKAASPTFCICELLGISLLLVWCILHIGIPNKGVCYAESFVLPTGLTLLCGSLSIKSYRIYKIFNSITISNQVFHSKVLVRYLAVLVIVSWIPVIVEIFVGSSKPIKTNIRSIQWVRCSGYDSELGWSLGIMALPIILVLFCVFMAFKTRNVISLWNEARPIALVTYNILFFGILYVIAKVFNEDLYTVTFYITVTIIYNVAMISLFVLFAPKFWAIWKDRKESWSQDVVLRDTNIPTHKCNISGRYVSSSGSGSGYCNGSCSGGRSGSVIGHGAAALGFMPDDLTSTPTPRSPRNSISNHDIASWARRPSRLGFEGRGLGDLDSQRSITNAVSNPIDPASLVVNEEDPNNSSQRSLNGTDPLNCNVYSRGGSHSDSVPAAAYSSLPGISRMLESYAKITGHSTSYQMLTMMEVNDGEEPRLKISTVQNSLLFIMFPSRLHIAYWLSLFSQQDLQSLKTLDLSPADNSISYTSGFSCEANTNSGVRKRQVGSSSAPHSLHSGSQRTSTAMTPALRNSEDFLRGDTVEASLSRLKQKKKQLGESSIQPIPGNSIENSGQPDLDPAMNASRNSNDVIAQDGSNSEGNTSSMFSDLEDQLAPVKLQRNPGQRVSWHPLVDNSTGVVSDDQEDESMANHSQVDESTVSETRLSTPTVGEDSDDSDDLYDPEFGIGGNGRRRNNNHRRSRSKFPSGSNDIHRTSAAGTAVIPSAAVISAAAAAVSAGWSESDALAAAMKDPTLAILNARTQTTRQTPS
ncbi:hypothetical protein BGZ76_010336 [Entomortierella beljakovae]|nr:hypothetical protein BGZ76_010336 [Entomortierella beljakovae]